MAIDGTEAKVGRTWADIFADFAKFLIPAGGALVALLILLLLLGKTLEIGPWKIQVTDPALRLAPTIIEPPGYPTNPPKPLLQGGGWGTPLTERSIPSSQDYAFC